jgi:hypothetical protein
MKVQLNEMEERVLLALAVEGGMTASEVCVAINANPGETKRALDFLKAHKKVRKYEDEGLTIWEGTNA